MLGPSDLTVYLSGEIHTDWRERIMSACADAGLRLDFTGPVIDHGASDDCGAAILGEEDNPFWRDHKGARINAIRTTVLIEQADVVVVRFGEKYKQWNAAFDAGYAAALGTPLIVMHPPEHTHALKEINGAAKATCETPEQVAQILTYVQTGRLPGR
jgi:YtoQ family protein